MFFMSLLLEFGSVKEIESYTEIEEMEVNTKIRTRGLIIEESILYGETKLLELENGVQLICECSENFEDKEVLAEGVVSEYEGKKQMTVLKITI